MEYKQIVFTKVNTAELLTMKCDIGDNDVCVETKISTVSCGTERANITGDPTTSIYDVSNEAVFPRYSGYSSSGVVIEKGKNVKSLEIGDRVAVYGGYHKSINIVNEQNAVKIPDNVSFNEAAMAYISTFPAAAIRKTELEFGESALVMGLGILGLISVQLCRAAGAVPVIAVDPIKEKRELALEFGADYAFDPTEPDFVEKVNAVTNGGANVVIEVTGLGVGLQQGLLVTSRFGRVSLLGCTRDKNFTIDYYRLVHGKGVKLIGAHTMARPYVESSHGMFTHTDDIKAVMKLCEGKRINLYDMIGGVFSPTECSEVYKHVIDDKKFPPVVQFDWDLIR